MPKSKSRRRLLWLLPVALVAVAGAGLAAMMLPPPADLDLALSKPTDKGLYVGTLQPGLSPIVVGKIHSWTIAVTTADGTPVEHATISLDGGMPQHGHGLPTVPQVTGESDGGRYTVEGMKFNMPGWWVIKLGVDGPEGADTSTFNLIL